METTNDNKLSKETLDALRAVKASLVCRNSFVRTLKGQVVNAIAMALGHLLIENIDNFTDPNISKVETLMSSVSNKSEQFLTYTNAQTVSEEEFETKYNDIINLLNELVDIITPITGIEKLDNNLEDMKEYL